MIAFINGHRHLYGVEPICRALQFAPSTYYAAQSRQPCKRKVEDEALEVEIARVRKENFDVYGVEKMWHQLLREGFQVGRDRVGRLMAEMGLIGARRNDHKTVTTKPAEEAERPADLVERNFVSRAPNRLWVADITYVWTKQGFCYVAFVIDVFSRFIVGWRVCTSLGSDLALDALEMAMWARGGELAGLVQHSDRGVQYLSIRYSERLADAEILASVGSKADSYDNALAETVNGLYKTELIRRRGPWRGVEHVEVETAAYVHWWNNHRLHSACGFIPPVELEEAYYAGLDTVVAKTTAEEAA